MKKSFLIISIVLTSLWRNDFLWSQDLCKFYVGQPLSARMTGGFIALQQTGSSTLLVKVVDPFKGFTL